METTSHDQGKASEVDFIALHPGQMIGRYQIVAILGQGGFGITYRAHDAQLNREVAIKEYLPMALAVRQDGTTVLPRSTKLADDFTWGRDRFVAEGRTLASLQRAPAIVRVFDFLEAHGTAYIVMELLAGDTLENRLKGGHKFGPAEIDRILWPLLDGLAQVHATGFLHRDIKPANILLDAEGNPTLIDFGASRAAMAGKTAAMTAIFTPGYAAAEQFTSAKQGPWTDIYGISATLYHAITGAPPPSAFDRMLDDDYQPLAKLRPAGFAPGLLIGIDTGLTVRASDRPQSIAGWRPVLGQSGAPDAQTTVALGRSDDSGATIMARSPVSADAVSAPTDRAAAKRRTVLLAVMAAAVIVALGGGYYVATKPATVDPAVAAEAQRARERLAAAEAGLRKAEGDAAKLRAEKEQREKADRDAAQRKQIEDETRQKIEAELAAARQKAENEAAAKRRAEAELRQAEEAEAAAKRAAEEQERRAAEAAEARLHHVLLDRQHIQVALTSLGFDTNTTDGVFGPRTREMIAAWQASRKFPVSGFLRGPQHQVLMSEAAPAIAKFNEEQKKAEETRKKADEEKVKAEAATNPATPTTAPATSAAPAAPNVASAAPKSGPDGTWRGQYQCTASRNGGAITIPMVINVTGGSGTWVRPGSGPGTGGNQSVAVRITGQQVLVSRVYVPGSQPGVLSTATLQARYDGANAITGSGPEHNGGGRTCDINLTRTP
jgi:peptidoglycan hydrolase-like protein with peptidoglycan-binding domain